MSADEGNNHITVVDQMWKLVETGAFSDCTIQIQGNPLKTFKLHKLMLFKTSLIFKKLLESDNCKDGIIKINDVSPRIMEQVIKHIYSCEFDQGLSCFDIRDLLNVGNKYEIITIKEACAKYAHKYLIKPENTLFLLDLISSINAENLEEHLLKMLEDETEKCLIGNFKFYISENTLIKVLNLNKCNLNSELDLIKFVNEWAAAKIKTMENVTPVDGYKIRKLIEPTILPLLRFLTLGKDEYLELLCVISWLTEEERQIISKSIINGKIPPEFPNYFSRITSKRCTTKNNRNVCTFPDLFSDEHRNKILFVKPTKLNSLHTVKFNNCKSFKFNFQVKVDNYCLVGIQFFNNKNGATGFDGKEKFYTDTISYSVKSGHVKIISHTMTSIVQCNSYSEISINTKLPINKSQVYTVQYYRTSTDCNDTLAVEYFEPSYKVQVDDLKVTMAGNFGSLRALLFKKSEN